MLKQISQDRVWKTAAWGDGVKALPDSGHAMPLHQNAAVKFAADDDRGHEGKAGAFAGEQAEHGHIVHFRSDDGSDAEPFENQVEGNADVAVETG